MQKVIILGAGTSGSSTAISILSENSDFKVTLIDRNFSRKPVRCAAGIGVEKLRRFGVEVPEDLIACKIDCFRIYSPDLNYWDFKSDEPVGYIIKRDAFDRWLIERAEGLGAELVEKNIENLKDLPDYDVLVLADGFPSLARSIGHPQPSPCDVEHCVQKVVKWASFPRDRIDIYFKRFSPGGYAWIFPKDGDECRIGLGIPLHLKMNPKALLDFFAYNVAYDLEDTELIGKLLPLSRPSKTGVYGNILLVGDSLPSIDPAFGGGVTESMISGRMAGKAIVENNLQNYDKYWKDLLWKENMFRYRVKKVLVSLSDRDWNGIVKMLGKEEYAVEADRGQVLKRVAHWILLRKPKLLLKYLFFR